MRSCHSARRITCSVVNATTPAQYFHFLRCQPLIVFTPKRMLRNAKAVSTIQELMTGGFREVIRGSAKLDPDKVSRVVLCSGQVYYDLAQAREERKSSSVAILRLEQIYPFPAEEVEEALSAYPANAEVIWSQEEPRNMGAWRSVQDSLQPMLDSSGRTLHYVGRAESASPAAGSLKRHQQEQAELIGNVFATGVDAELQGMHLVTG